jgi:hypothetical protein
VRHGAHRILWTVALASGLGFAAQSARADVTASTATAVSASTAPAAAQAPDEPVYVYNSAGRDPFIPLSGGPAADMGSQDKEVGAFNPTSVELKGILRTLTGRWAVLSGNGGERYVVENGKLLDPKKKAVEGYVGIIKEKTLVLIGPNNQVTELKLKRDQTAEDQMKSKK